MDLITRIVNGGVNMPAYTNLVKPEEIDALVAFLQSRSRVPNEQKKVGYSSGKTAAARPDAAKSDR